MEKLKMGSIYFQGAPMKPGFNYESWDEIAIGSTVPGFEIQWVPLSNGMLIADRRVCNNISWTQLNSFGLIFGTVIQIDGENYLCRSLSVESKDNNPNEWDMALNEVGEDNRIWYWKDCFFWGQEEALVDSALRLVRGGVSARYQVDYIESVQNPYVGLRPVLERVTPIPQDYNSLAGKTIAPMGPDNRFVTGKLVSVTDYDLVLEQSSSLPDECKWAIPDGKYVVIDRSCVSWMREV